VVRDGSSPRKEILNLVYEGGPTGSSWTLTEDCARTVPTPSPSEPISPPYPVPTGLRWCEMG